MNTKTNRPNLDEKISTIDATIERLSKMPTTYNCLSFIRGCQDPDVRGVLFASYLFGCKNPIVDNIYALEQLKTALLNGEY